MPIIAMSGRAGSGKDTVGRMIAQTLGPGNVKLIAFAEPLKTICKEVFDWTDDHVYGDLKGVPDERYKRGTRSYTFPNGPPGTAWVPLANARGYALVDAEDLDRTASISWSWMKPRNTTYAKGRVDGKQTTLHRFILGARAGQFVDHVNGDGLDNRKTNLRFGTRAQNAQNMAATEGKSSAFKGVSWDKRVGKWRAYIKPPDGKRVTIGYFDDDRLAASAYDKAALELFGAFARTNTQMFLTPREALQTLGTNWGRACYEDIWAALGLRRARAWLAKNPPFRSVARDGDLLDDGPWHVPNIAVITDCRFVNEARLVHAAGGKVWFIARDVGDAAGGITGHPSEAEMMGDEFQGMVDVRLDNHGTMEVLSATVARMLAMYAAACWES